MELLPDIEIEDAPSAQEIELYRRALVDRRTLGTYINKFEIEGAPPELHYEWGRDDPLTQAYYQERGFRINEALAARSKFLNADKSQGNRIQDVACYSIRVERKRAIDEATEITKRMKADPRKTYMDVAKEYLDSSYESLPIEEGVYAQKREVLDGKTAKMEILSDQSNQR
jgi:hypothetical protein